MAVSELLSSTGKAFFSVRRDIKKNGFRKHMLNGNMVYQCNVILPYRSILKMEHCKIYQYQHYSAASHPENTNCPFCNPDAGREIITESATVYALLDKYPVSPGHTLIIPKKHIANYFELPERSKHACWLVVDRVKELLNQRFKPDGFNIGINIGKDGGQTVPHVHIHLIPRYTGDVLDPVGGVRNIIPGKGKYF
jgi:diadenosine tetraphosphate (Ap4A) HIT family hydrolase